MRFLYHHRKSISMLALSVFLIGTTVTPASGYYNPKLGRFVQRDPHGMPIVLQAGLRYHGVNPVVTVSMAYELQYADGMNFYQYLRSNAINRNDPSGMFTLAELVARLGVYGALAGGALAWMNKYATFSDYDPLTAPKGSNWRLAAASFVGAGFGAGSAVGMGLLAGAIAAGGTISLGTATVSVGMMFTPMGFGLALENRIDAETDAEVLVANIELAGAGIGLLGSHVATFLKPNLPRFRVPRSRWPEGAAHVQDAQRRGQPKVVTLDRPGRIARSRAARQGYSTVPGKDLDEYPPAIFKEGGKGADIRPIDLHENRSMGAAMGNALRDLPDGSKVILEATE